MAELEAPLDDSEQACSDWLGLAERRLVKILEVDSASMRRYLGRDKDIEMARKPFGELQQNQAAEA